MTGLDIVSEMVTQRPSARLATAVVRYIGYRLDGFPAGLHRGLPSRHLTFIVSLDRPVEMQLSPDQHGPHIAMQAFVGGLQTWPAQIHHDGRQEGIAVELTPLGASAVLGVPGGELAGQVVELDSVLGARGRHVTERLLNTSGWPDRFALLDDALMQGYSERHGAPEEIVHAWDQMVKRPGDLDVVALAREIGWSRRHLTERMRRETGLPPRQLARVLRFERSCALLRQPHARSLTDVAMTAGYFDHAHMIHEWQRLAGCPPSAWLREEFPSVQDEPPLGDAH